MKNSKSLHNIFLIVLIYPIITFGQTSKGTLLTSFKFGGRDVKSISERNSFSGTNKTESKFIQYRPELSVRYFYYDKLSAGIHLGYNYSKSINIYTSSDNRYEDFNHTYPVSLNLTKYVRLTSITNFYLGIYYSQSSGRNYSYSYQYDIETQYNKHNSKYKAYGINLGMMVNISKRWALNVETKGIERYWSESKQDDEEYKYTTNGWETNLDLTSISVGVSYFIRRTEPKDQSK